MRASVGAVAPCRVSLDVPPKYRFGDCVVGYASSVEVGSAKEAG